METIQDMTKIKKEDIPEIKSDNDVLELYSDQHPFRLSLRINNFDSDTEFTKFVRNCERMIRTSIEYKLWRNYIIDVLGIGPVEPEIKKAKKAPAPKKKSAPKKKKK